MSGVSKIKIGHFEFHIAVFIDYETDERYVRTEDMDEILDKYNRLVKELQVDNKEE